MSIKRVAVYGSTGSIGTQALEVIQANPDHFIATVLTAQENHTLLIEQAKKFKPQIVVIGNEAKFKEVNDALAPLNITVYTGADALVQVAKLDVYDLLLAAIVGYAGLKSTYAAVTQGKIVALANKESLVVAGDIMTEAVIKHKSALIPVDSEHSAIFQCLVGEQGNPIENIILTASGGPFLGKKPNFLLNVRKSHALQHPNWTMGAKITIDSATLMNKGLEMIEAKWLFSLKNEQIKVVVHPQSIIHSMVTFEDGSIKAQMGLPDMKLPIQYALSFPKRLKNEFPRLDLKNYSSLTFEEPDTRTFRNLALATQAMFQGDNAPCILNAANEVVVAGFLNNKITFLGMSDVIQECLEKIPQRSNKSIEEYEEDDLSTRGLASELLKKHSL